MCRNIKTLFNFDPPATEEEVRAAALQFVRKLSGFQSPSKTNEEAFQTAVEEVAAAARKLLSSMVTAAGPRDRQMESEKARLRNIRRFGSRPESEPEPARSVSQAQPQENGGRGDGELPAGIGRPARRALDQLGIARLEQLAGFTEAEVLKQHGMGPKALGILRSALAAKDMAFALHPSRPSGPAAGRDR